MISAPVTNSPEIWPCVLSIMTSYFTSTTVDIHSNVDITPVIKTSQWTFFLTDELYLPRRNASADLLIIAEDVDKVHLAGVYGRVIAVTGNLNSAYALWLRKRLHDTVVIYVNGASINAYTWFPYDPKHCWTGVRYEFLAKCSNGEWGATHLYPNKVPGDFKGCPVIYQTFPTPPHNLYNPVTKTFTGGRELKLMQLLGKSVNLTIQLMPFTPHFYFYPHEESAVHRLKNGEIDFAFGSMTINQFFMPHAEPLQSHSDLSMVWMLPRARPKNKITNIHTGFPFNMWLIISLVLILSELSVGIIAWTKNLHWNWLDLIAAQIASPVSTHKSTYMTAFIFLFQVYSLHIAWFYQGCLLGNLFKIPMERQIQSPGEAADRGLHAVLYNRQSIYFNDTDHEMWNKVLTPGRHNLTNQYDLSEFYDDVVKDGTAYLLCDLNRDGYELRRKYNRTLNSMVFTVLYINFPVAVYSVRGSPLTDLFTRQMSHAIQSGLYDYLKNSETYSKDIAWKTNSASAQVLTLETLGGAFYVLHCFLTFSVIVFICKVVFDIGYRQGKKCYRKKILLNEQAHCVVHDYKNW